MLGKHLGLREAVHVSGCEGDCHGVPLACQAPFWRAGGLKEGKSRIWAVLPLAEPVDRGFTSSKYSCDFCGLLVLKLRVKT